MDEAIKTLSVRIRMDPAEKTDMRWAAKESGHPGISSFLRWLGLREARRLRQRRAGRRARSR